VAKTLRTLCNFVQKPTTSFPVLSLCAVFVGLGLLFIPRAGIHNDEAIFTSPIYQHAFEFRIRLFHHNLPLMIMTYLGTLKTLLYLPILALFPAGPFSVRMPMVLAGAVTIFIFFLLAERISGRLAALIATLLLATDPIFLLTDTFDWGPVAIEHLLLVTACWAVVKYSQDGAQNHHWLAAGFLCLGLALWNKAVFLWALTGLVAALATVCPGQVRRLLQARRIRIAIAALVIGASPLLIYNLHNRNATISSSANLEIPDWSTKLLQVRMALNGMSLFGYLVSPEDRDGPKTPATIPGRFALAVRERLGEHVTSLGDYAALACLLAVPLWRKSRPAWFALIFCVVTWLMMAITKGAGGSAHHVVLLWPFPQLFMGIVLAAIPWRPITALFAAALALSNLLVINQYLLQIERDGPGPTFSDAIYGLSEALRPHASQTVYVTDWGMQNSLALLQKGRLRLEIAEGDFLSDELGEPQRAHIAKMAADRDALFIGHVLGQEAFPGSYERVIHAAENAGLHKEIIQTIADSNGRPAFEIFRWSGPSRDAAP
jgi:4-amino-4-deoxy-L-arabinose transferase-like glycosyltransferase